MAYIKGIIGSIAGIFLIIFGVVISRKKNVYTKQVNFTVKTVEKITGKVNTGGKPVVDYKLTGSVVECSNNIITITNYSKEVVVGQVISVWMRENCIGSDAVETTVSNQTAGYVMIGVGVAIILFTIITIYFVRKYKFAAAAHGANDILNIFN